MTPPKFPPTTRPKAILFDWDNTLVDTWPAIHQTLNATFDAYDLVPWTLAETKVRVRKSMRDSFPALFGEQWEEAGQFFYQHFDKIHLEYLVAVPGAEEALSKLLDAGFFMSIVSNKRGEYLRKEIDHLNWGRYFTHAVGANDAPQDKPAVEPVEMALSGSGIPRGTDVWFVGDTNIDMECAANAQCLGVLVRDEPPTDGEFDVFPPHLHLDTCPALFDFITKLK